MTRSSARPRILPRVALILLVLLGPALFVVGQVNVRADAALGRDGARALGTVVSFADTQRASQRDVRVDFVAADGITRTVSAHADHDQHPAPGDAAEVAYDQADPERAVVLGYDSTWQPVAGLGLVLSVITIGIGAAALVSLAVRARRSRQMV
ncbi:MAG: DUF3592 domain-containing protein [Actinomycetota bacterium]